MLNDLARAMKALEGKKARPKTTKTGVPEGDRTTKRQAKTTASGSR
jgi:hypothetical protein